MKNVILLTTFLQKLNPYFDRDVLLLAGLVKIGQIAGFNRIQGKSTLIGTYENTVLANVYGLTFLDSGEGKDKPLNDIESMFMRDILRHYYDRGLEFAQEYKNKIKQQAEELYPDSKSERNKYIAANAPRTLSYEMQDATMEGLIAQREALHEAGFGGTFVRISEFGDYISSRSDVKSAFLSLMNDIFDRGNNAPKIIKGERRAVPVYGVPSNAIMHTSPAGLIEQGEANSRLMSFLNRGQARRALVCYPLKKKQVDMTVQKKHDLRREAQALVPQLKQVFDDMYNNTKEDDVVERNQTLNVFIFTPEAEQRIEEYEIANQTKGRAIVSSDLAGVRSDIINRHYKAMKVATLIAAFEHPTIKEVTVQDVEGAIRLCEMYGEHLRRFYQAKPETDVQKLYNYFVENKGKWLSKMDIYEQKFVVRNATSQWLSDKLPMVEELAERNGLSIECEKFGKNGYKYRIIEIASDALLEEAEMQKAVDSLQNLP